MDEKNYLVVAAGLLVAAIVFGALQFADTLIGFAPKGGADVYHIAVYKDAVTALGIASSPDYLGSLLESRGYTVQYLDGTDLANAEVFNAKNLDLVVLPYGGTFPEDAVGNMTMFLMDGGSFFSTGGYTFDGLEQDFLNTRYGYAIGDAMSVYEEQVGVFDPDFPLERVTYALANYDQAVISRDIVLDASLSGYAASGFFGNGNPVFADVNGRRIPLMYGYDKYGRNRGSIGAIIYNYKGAFEGSAWGFFGVTNKDVFSTDYPEMEKAFLDIIEHMLTKTFICSITTNYACYRQGEKVVVSADLADYGKQGRELTIKVSISAGEDIPGDVVFTETMDIALRPKETRTVNVTWEPVSFASDFYTVTVEVYMNDRLWDIERTGFVVWDESVIKSGPKVVYNDNYFTIDGQTELIFGVKSAGFQFASPLENPLNWAKEIEYMRDNGINAFEIIHMSGFMKDFTSPDETVVRKLDALVQLSQKYRVVYKIGVFDWTSIVQSDKEMQERLKWVEFLAKRYEGVPGIMFDLMGDIPLIDFKDMHQPDIAREFTKFIEEKYPVASQRQEIWGRTSGPYPIEFTNLPFDIADTRVADVLLFRNKLFSEWTYGAATILRKYFENNTVHAEYYADPYWYNPRVGSKHLDFSTIGYYADVEDFPRIFKYTDLRVEGKSMGLNEFGVKTHPSWRGKGFGYQEREDAINHFLGITHYSIGLGASHILVWQWKDMVESIFPWGMVHSGDLVPKDVLGVYMYTSRLFNSEQIVYTPPEVYVFVSNRHYSGQNRTRYERLVHNSIMLLLKNKYSIGIVDEGSIHLLPNTAKAVIAPAPFMLSDETYKHLKDFVLDGGSLYVSGDISYDEFARYNKVHRLEDLVGITNIQRLYPYLDYSKGVTKSFIPLQGFDVEAFQGTPTVKFNLDTAIAIAVDEEGNPLVVVNELGNGKVLFMPDIFEMRASSLLDKYASWYRAFLEEAGVEQISILQDNRYIDVFEQRTKDEGTLYFLRNTKVDDGDLQSLVLSTPAGAVGLSLRGKKTGFLSTRLDGRIISIETQGNVTVDNQVVVSTNAHVGLVSLDKYDIRESSAILVLPFSEGELRLLVPTSWQGVSCVVGEIRDGYWRELGSKEVKVDDRTMEIVIEHDDTLTTFIVIYDRGVDIEDIFARFLSKNK